MAESMRQKLSGSRINELLTLRTGGFLKRGIFEHESRVRSTFGGGESAKDDQR